VGQANFDLVRHVHRVWNEDGCPLGSGLLDPAIEWVNPPGAMEPGVRRGLEAFGRAAANVRECFDDARIEIERLIAPDRHRVVTIGTWRGRGRNSAVEITRRMGYIWTLREGSVIRFEWFHEPSAALEAAGLTGEEMGRAGLEAATSSLSSR
jgi:ketosteroid isomerase-like protein